MDQNISRRRALAVALSCFALFGASAHASEFQMIYKVSGIKQAAPAEEPSAFTSHTFTTCGKTAGQGPSLADCQAAYAAAAWMNEPDAFSIHRDGTKLQGIQVWTVPKTGTYRIEAAGASRAAAKTYDSLNGRGAVISGEFSLQQGQKLLLLVGQNQPTWPYDGVGGTFVVDQATLSPLIVAGGGGGFSGIGGGPCVGADASTSTAGNPGCGSARTNGGTNGGAGVSNIGAGGGGLLTDSKAATYNGAKGYGFTSIYNGTAPSISANFGGGGAYVNPHTGTVSSGGGGGYSGGGTGQDGGGGGGSLNTGSSPQVLDPNPTGNAGHITITRL
jgi:hypothetical protein